VGITGEQFLKAANHSGRSVLPGGAPGGVPVTAAAAATRRGRDDRRGWGRGGCDGMGTKEDHWRVL